MSPRCHREIRDAEMREHPVHAAWDRLEAPPAGISAIEIWRETPGHQPASVYRLALRNGRALPVFAKRCDAASGSVERLCYEEIVPRLGLSSPAYLGSVEESDGTIWFFVEDVGREKFSALDAMHRALASRWLARLHAKGARLEAGRRLPDGGPGRYLLHLRESRARIQCSVGNPAITREQRELLAGVLVTLDRIEGSWESLSSACAVLPETVVHGDFRPKNVRIRDEASGPALYALDWELAGWGVPVADLAPARGDIALLPIDPGIYAAETRAEGRSLDATAIRQLSMIGCLMRRLAAIHWDAMMLHHEDPRCLSSPISSLQVFQRELSAALALAQEWLE